MLLLEIMQLLRVRKVMCNVPGFSVLELKLNSSGPRLDKHVMDMDYVGSWPEHHY